MKVLELFAGTRSIGKAFEKRGHEVYSIDWDRNMSNIDLYADISKLKAEDILAKFGKPDVVWASPDCTTYSIAGISHHREKDEETGELKPISEYAKFCDETNQNVLKLIKELEPRYYFIENPRGRPKKDVIHAGNTEIHNNVLPIRRYQNEAHRHLDKSPKPKIQITMQKRRPMPRTGTKRKQDRNPRIEKQSHESSNTGRIMQPHRRHL